MEDFKVINRELASFTGSPVKHEADPFADDDGTMSRITHWPGSR